MNYLEKRAERDRLTKCLAAGDWKTVLEAYNDGNEDSAYHEPLLVWIRPSMDLLQFIEKELSSLGIR